MRATEVLQKCLSGALDSMHAVRSRVLLHAVEATAKQGSESTFQNRGRQQNRGQNRGQSRLLNNGTSSSRRPNKGTSRIKRNALASPANVVDEISLPRPL